MRLHVLVSFFYHSRVFLLVANRLVARYSNNLLKYFLSCKQKRLDQVTVDHLEARHVFAVVSKSLHSAFNLLLRLGYSVILAVEDYAGVEERC